MGRPDALHQRQNHTCYGAVQAPGYPAGDGVAGFRMSGLVILTYPAEIRATDSLHRRAPIRYCEASEL